MPQDSGTDIEAFLTTLPDPAAARNFLSRLYNRHPLRAAECARDPLFLSRLLTLAAYSTFLAEDLLRHPEDIDWLRRESRGDLDRVKSTEQLREDLARFSGRLVETEPRAYLARFKRRELLRIYLRDCLGVARLAEVTEELSNLADVVLSHTLAAASGELTRLYGSPLTRDERGRMSQAEFVVVALGKLGCRELNYASDIDLNFLYRGQGQTAGDGRRAESVISNKDFFTAVANRIVQVIGSNTGEGSVFRIDLRLRPYGRDGDLVWEIDSAADYYRSRAQAWERQALIRARAAAGSEAAFLGFFDKVRGSVFQQGALFDALDEVRRAKEKIDRKAAGQVGGFNVKLGRGGIREIEFIAQALQLAYGGREPWVRSAQTLIVLARLAEKNYLSEAERARLSGAYTFLRTVEHRLQMDQGVQTHRLPVARERLELLARRSGYAGAHDPVAAFIQDLEAHTSVVRAIYNRVFIKVAAAGLQKGAGSDEPRLDDETARLIKQAVSALDRALPAELTARPVADQPEADRLEAGREETISEAVKTALVAVINPVRSLRNLISWAESLATYDRAHTNALDPDLFGEQLPKFIERLLVILSSQYFSHILVSRPALAVALGIVAPDDPAAPQVTRDFLSELTDASARETEVAAKTDALRREWYRHVLAIGYSDISTASGFRASRQTATRQARTESDYSEIKQRAAVLRANNREQTSLAEAALRLGVEIAFASMGVRDPQPFMKGFAVLGLGRLGHAGMDYGSDLDLLVVFDDEGLWPPAGLDPAAAAQAGMAAPHEFYAKLTSHLVRVLSSVTREGFLYQIDLRLRPDGKSGPLAMALRGLLGYLRDRASAWEHSAYLKAREVAGDLQFGARARAKICEAVFSAASLNPSLKQELAEMRARIEKEKVRPGRANIKWGRGAMTDVYFITRYLQLRDLIYFPPERGTTRLIEHLGEAGAIDRRSAETLFEGYSFLRGLDHWMRLLLDRPSPVLPISQVALEDIALALGLTSIQELESEHARHTGAIRQVYDQVFDQGESPVRIG